VGRVIAELVLTRNAVQNEVCTLGVLQAFGFTFYTVEDPWNDNKPFGSCIPLGVYAMLRHNTPHHPNTWALVNPSLDIYHLPSDIPTERKGKGRFACLIHAGNTAKDVEGCIAIGLVRGENGVGKSVKAMEKFRELMSQQTGIKFFNLKIEKGAE
jgi:hypothetical protein